MKKLSILFAFVAVFGLAVVACGDDDDKNACEKAADVMKDGMDSYCTGKADTCWFCDCYNQGQEMDVTVDGTTMTYSCKAPTATGETTCDGSSLDSANTCLDNKATCESDASSAAQSACDASSK